MQEDYDKVPSLIEINAPIDFEVLKNEVEANGPLCLSNANNPYKVILTPTPCRCSDQGCTQELVMVSRQHGFFEMQWVLSKSDFLQFDSLDAFFSYAISGALQDSRGERMVVEAHVKRVFRDTSDAGHEHACPCPKCLAERVGEDTRNIFLISQLANLLIDRKELLQEAREWDELNPDSETENVKKSQLSEGSLEDWVEYSFELGYSLGRNFSEYSGIANIEPLALLGVKANSTKEKREVATGRKSRELREKRRSNIFMHMEALTGRNPDIAKLLGADGVAKLALKECIKENAAMWKQGPGQVAEYLGEIRRGEAGPDMKKRYQAIFGNKPPKRFDGSHETA